MQDDSAQTQKMRIVPILILIGLAGPADAQTDAERRADQARTEQLNRDIMVANERLNTSHRLEQDHYRDALTEYKRARTAWRRQLADCTAGDDHAYMPR